MKTSIIVQNLKCGGCAKTIVSELSEINGIENMMVDDDSSIVSFAYINVDEALLVKEKLKTIGYPSIDTKNSVLSKVKTFVSCASGRMK